MKDLEKIIKIQIIKDLIKELEEHCINYYKYDAPTISDAEYDKLYDKLASLEQETGFIMSNSPTQKVKGYLLSDFIKVVHSSPMLSAQKTKDDNEIKEFIKHLPVVMSYKLDGMTIVLKYNNGNLVQAISRGDGEIGEDITENVKVFKNVPLHLDFKGELELRGEGVISWENFNRLKNESTEDEYSHPRNLASGSIRQKDISITKERQLEFIAFELIDVKGIEKPISSRGEELLFLSMLGFDVVEHYNYNPIEENYKYYDNFINRFEENYKYPVDGIIIRFNDLKYGKSLGSTAHHPLDMIARKWADKLYETVLLDIEWNTSMYGVLCPTAIFKTVDIDGTSVSRATLNNYEYIKNLKLGIGDKIKVSRRNMVIPAVEENITCSDNYEFPKVCPSCGEPIEERKENKTTFLFCKNINCPAKAVGRLQNFASKRGLNIEGMSSSTIEKFYQKGILTSYEDFFKIETYKEEICSMSGFGEKSYKKMKSAIEKAKNCTVDKFIYGLGIPNIGTVAAKQIAKHYSYNWKNLYDNVLTDDFTELEDFGEVAHNNIINFFTEERKTGYVNKLASYMNFIEPKTSNVININNNIFKDKSFCISGSFSIGSRDELKEKIEMMGGKFVSGVSKKTNILVAGEKCGSKLTKAKEYGTRIIEENELKDILEVQE